MDKLTKITRAETTYVEQNWRQGVGGRVLTFDMMLELPHSPNVAALGRNSEIAFEDERYIVSHKEVVRRTPPEVVRIALNRTGGAAETLSDRSRRPASPAYNSGPQAVTLVDVKGPVFYVRIAALASRGTLL